MFAGEVLKITQAESGKVLVESGTTGHGPKLEIVLYCIALHCIAVHCIALHCIALNCIALHCIALYCIVLYYSIPVLSK